MFSYMQSLNFSCPLLFGKLLKHVHCQNETWNRGSRTVGTAQGEDEGSSQNVGECQSHNFASDLKDNSFRSKKENGGFKEKYFQGKECILVDVEIIMEW